MPPRRSRATVVTYHSDVVRQRRAALYRPFMMRACAGQVASW